MWHTYTEIKLAYKYYILGGEIRNRLWSKNSILGWVCEFIFPVITFFEHQNKGSYIPLIGIVTVILTLKLA